MDQIWYEEPGGRPTEYIEPIIMRAINKAANYGAILLYFSSDFDRRLREHRFIKKLVEMEMISGLSIQPKREMIEYFRANKRRDEVIAAEKRRRRKISVAVKGAIQNGATPGLLTIEARAIRSKARAAVDTRTLKFYADLLNFIADIDVVAGSYSELARILNERKRPTSRGKTWSAETVKRAIQKFEYLEAEFGRYVVPYQLRKLR